MTRICPRLALGFFLTATLASAQRGAPIPQQLTFERYHGSGIYTYDGFSNLTQQTVLRVRCRP